MTKLAIEKKLKSKGYKVTSDLCGMYIARKNQQSYKANSLNELHRLIFE
jgi:hypothetical protein